MKTEDNTGKEPDVAQVSVPTTAIVIAITMHRAIVPGDVSLYEARCPWRPASGAHTSCWSRALTADL